MREDRDNEKRKAPTENKIRDLRTYARKMQIKQQVNKTLSKQG